MSYRIGQVVYYTQDFASLDEIIFGHKVLKSIPAVIQSEPFDWEQRRDFGKEKCYYVALAYNGNFIIPEELLDVEPLELS